MAERARHPGPAFRARANHLIAVGRAADAVPLLRQALAANPDDTNAHCTLALAFLSLEDPQAALDAATRADPGSEWMHRLQSIALRHLGRNREALAAAREALRLAPERPEALAVVIDAELACREHAAAQEHAETLRTMAPERELAHQVLGRVSLDAHDWTAAETHFRRALAIAPTSWESMNNLALSLRHQGRHEEAIARFHDAARLQPTSKVVQTNLSASVARYAGTGALGVWLGVEALRFVGLGLSRPAIVPVLFVAAAAGVLWSVRRRKQRLRALHPAVQAFYADYAANRPWRPTWLYVRNVVPPIAARLAPVGVAIFVVGRTVEYYASPRWEPVIALAAVVAVIAGGVAAVRRGVAAAAR